MKLGCDSEEWFVDVVAISVTFGSGWTCEIEYLTILLQVSILVGGMMVIHYCRLIHDLNQHFYFVDIEF